MKKVVYSVMKSGRKDTKITGLGYIADDDLIIACLSKDSSKPYIRIFDGCVSRCHLVIGTTDEYKGAYYEIREIEVDVTDTHGNSVGSFETREIEVDYNVWFKILD